MTKKTEAMHTMPKTEVLGIGEEKKLDAVSVKYVSYIAPDMSFHATGRRLPVGCKTRNHS